MLATLVDRPFDGQEWLYEVKWDGYRSVAFLENGSARLVSRNQNDLTAAYPELRSIPVSSKREPQFWTVRLSRSMRRDVLPSA